MCGQRVARGATAASVAAQLGFPVHRVEKAVWLARRYPPAVRRAIGTEVLAGLGPAHLEAAAVVAPEPRAELLRRAYAEGMSVRELRRLVRSAGTPAPAPGSAPGAVVSGAAADLASARRAVEVYSTLPDHTLAKVLQGPNGEVISGLAEAGRALAERMAVARLG